MTEAMMQEKMALDKFVIQKMKPLESQRKMRVQAKGPREMSRLNFLLDQVACGRL